MFLRKVSVQLTSDKLSHPETQNRNNYAKTLDTRNKKIEASGRKFVCSISSSQGLNSEAFLSNIISFARPQLRSLSKQYHLFRKASTQKPFYATSSLSQGLNSKAFLSNIISFARPQLRSLSMQRQLKARPQHGNV